MLRTTLKSWITAGAGTAAALTIAGFFGAFAALPSPPVPDLPTGEAIEAGQWRVLPVRAYVGTDHPYGVPLKPEQKALVLEVDLTNRTAESTKDFFELFAVVGGIGQGGDQPFVALTRDSTLSPDLHPGMPERMAFVWPLPGDAAVPPRVSIAVTAKIYKPRDNLYGAPGWFNPHLVGAITLPVADVRTASAGAQ
jgi:hypothetical protein